MARRRYRETHQAAARAAYVEAFRTLRANVSLNASAQGMRSLLVTSAGAGEGKTTTAANLAILMAESEQRVVLVDGDFRRSRLQRVIETEEKPTPSAVERFWEEHPTPAGLAEMIARRATLVEVAQRARGLDNLTLVPCGAIPPHPAELLASEEMRTVMGELCDHADLVLIDTPPCLLYSDAIELTRVVDGVVYVIRAGEQQADHPRALKLLQQSRARLVGLVVNQLEGMPHGYVKHAGQGGGHA